MNEEAAERSNGEIWHERFLDLVELVKSYAWFDEREDFYRSLAAKLKEITKADSVNIRLLTPTQDSFVLYAFSGDVESVVNKKFGVLDASAGRMPHLIETGEPIIFDFENPETDDIEWDRGAKDGFSQSVTIALPGVQGIVGTADFLYHEPRQWPRSDIDWLRSMGEFVGATIGNALLSDNMFSLRVAEERRNLANEIHDNVAQSVSVISLETDQALLALEQHDLEALRHNLDLIKRASDEVENGVRGELANLGANSAAGKESPMEQLEEVASAFCTQWGLACTMSADERSRKKVIPPRIMTQLTRVVNEALVNVVRHARTEKVELSYEVTDDGLSLVIEDAGCGFEAAAVSPSHLGLRIMRERLDSIGASLDIVSSIGTGTRLLISVPYLV